MSELRGINDVVLSDLMEPDRPTAAAHVAPLLGRARHLHPRNGESGRGPKSSRSLLEHAFVFSGTGPSQG